MRSRSSGGPPGQLVALTVDDRGGGRPGSARVADGCVLPCLRDAAIVVELVVHAISPGMTVVMRGHHLRPSSGRGSTGWGSTTPGSPAQWLSAASSPRHAPPDLHLAHEEYESRQAGNALSRTAGQSVALAGPTGRPRSRHGHLRGEGRAGVGRSWIRSTIAQRLMYSGPLNWAGPADRWADGGGSGRWAEVCPLVGPAAVESSKVDWRWRLQAPGIARGTGRPMGRWYHWKSETGGISEDN